MLGFAQAGQVRVKGGDGRALVAQIDLNLTEVLSLLQQMSRVGVAQRMDVGWLGEAAGLERQTKRALQRRAAHRLGGGARAQSAMTLGGKEQDWMTVGFPLLAQAQQRATGQRDVAILVAFAPTDVQEHAFRIDVADFQPKPFAQSQAAGVNGDKADPMIQGGNAG